MTGRLAAWAEAFKARPLSALGLALIVFFVVVAVFAPALAPAESRSCDPYLIPEFGYSPDPLPPSREHRFGTTQEQYDLYYGMVWGTRTAFRVALSVVAAALAAGVLVGGLSGFYDVILAFPALLLAVVIVAVLGPSLEHVMLSVAAVAWPSYARLLRGEVLALKGREFVLAARGLGATDARILFRHILPNAVYPMLVYASLDVGNIVITAAALSFLGLGAPIGYADWGQLVSLSRNWILGAPGHPFAYWHTIVIPGGAIFLFVLGWNLLGDGVRDILDPRSRQR